MFWQSLSIHYLFNLAKLMIMKTNLRKMILWTIALLAISIMTTSSVNPGYDEFGNDINECLEDPCPEGYTCMNLPGSFL